MLCFIVLLACVVCCFFDRVFMFVFMFWVFFCVVLLLCVFCVCGVLVFALWFVLCFLFDVVVVV